MFTQEKLRNALREHDDAKTHIVGVHINRGTNPLVIEFLPKKHSKLGKQGLSRHTYEYSDKNPGGKMSWGAAKKQIDTDSRGNPIYRSTDEIAKTNAKYPDFYGDGLGTATEEIISDILNSVTDALPDLPKTVIVMLDKPGEYSDFFVNKARRSKEEEKAEYKANRASIDAKSAATRAANAQKAEDDPANVQVKEELKKNVTKFIEDRGYDVKEVNVTLKEVKVKISAASDVKYTWELVYNYGKCIHAACSTRKKSPDTKFAEKMVSEFELKRLVVEFESK